MYKLSSLYLPIALQIDYVPDKPNFFKIKINKIWVLNNTTY